MKRRRARGEGFFAAADTQPYQPSGIVLGQETPDSCVAACCRMLLFDHLPVRRQDYRYAECFVRTALETDQNGGVITLIPETLRQFGLPDEYVFYRGLTVEKLRELAVAKPVIALVQPDPAGKLHALLVDLVSDREVALRDPLPIGYGTAYRLALPVFLTCWLRGETGCGLAVAVLE